MVLTLINNSWEQCKLGELGEIMTGCTPSTLKSEYYSEDGIPWVTPTDINAQTISDTPRKLSEEGMKVGRVVPANTILCTCIASVGKNTLLTVKGSFNQQINSLTPYVENDAYFLLAESELWSDKMKRMAASGTMQIVNKTEFSELTTMVPKIEEQKKIGEYFSNLDSLITLHQRKFEKLTQIKKSLLEKMFPADGANTPKIRFKGFTEAWEQRVIGDIFQFERPDKYMIEDDRYQETGVPVLTANKGFILGYRDESGAYDKGDCIIYDDFTLDSKFVDFPFKVNSSVIKILTSKDGSDLLFDYFLLSRTPILQQGHARHYISVVQPTEVMVPSKQESIKIKVFLSNIDSLITLHQRKYEKLKNIKKSLLEKMFV